jgi:allantoin racemase
MGTKILWQDIWTRDIPLLGIEDSGPMYEAMNELLFKKVAREDTQIEIRHVKRSSYMVMSSYLELLNNVELIGEIIQAEKEGFDAAIIGCGNDPGLYQAREAVNIPVVGPTETAMHLACLLGGKFAAITIIKRLVPFIERNLKFYGLESRAIDREPIRSCEVGYEFSKWFSLPSYISEHIIPSFEKIAKECVNEGAEVIVTACCGLGPALTMAGYNKVAGTEVPVIDCASVAIKMAELLSDVRKSLGISTSKSLTYQSLPKEVVEKLQRPFYS